MCNDLCQSESKEASNRNILFPGELPTMKLLFKKEKKGLSLKAASDLHNWDTVTSG